MQLVIVQLDNYSNTSHNVQISAIAPPTTPLPLPVGGEGGGAY